MTPETDMPGIDSEQTFNSFDSFNDATDATDAIDAIDASDTLTRAESWLLCSSLTTLGVVISLVCFI